MKAQKNHQVYKISRKNYQEILLINSLNKQGYNDIKNIINGLNYYKVITSDSVLTINKNTLDIVDIYQDLTKGDK